MAFRTGLTRTGSVRLLALTVLLLLGASGALAQADDPPANEGELKEAMHRFFEKRLRAELSLTDEQIEHIIPRVRRSEQLRTEARQERQRTVRRLQRGMHEGADDAELQALLDELDGIDEGLRAGEREILAEIDTVLSVRQRVQYRFFSVQFRQELQRRIREMRQQGGGAPFGRRQRRP